MTDFGELHQLGGSTEVDMYKMSVIGHISLKNISNNTKKIKIVRQRPLTSAKVDIERVEHGQWKTRFITNVYVNKGCNEIA